MGIWERLFKREVQRTQRVNEMLVCGRATGARGVEVGRDAPMLLMRPPAARFDILIRRPRMNGEVALRELQAARRDVSRGRLSHAQLERWIDQHWDECERRTAHNTVCTGGVNDLISVYFKGTAVPGAWYVGCIKGAAPTFDIADTPAAHAGWTEVASTDVAEATRQAFTLGAVAAGSVNNTAAKAVYTGAASWTAQGLFIANKSAFADATGILYSEAAFTEGAAAMQVGYILSLGGTVGVTAG
jgi:hypothetical protein